jgi:hypothetical protein
VSIYSSDIPCSPSHATPQPNQQTPLLPRRLANSAVRRTQQASTLASSPPRLGHSSCMRQIFSVSSIRALPQGDDGVTYPLLPNLSQTPSPAKRDNQVWQTGDRDIPPLLTTEADSAVPDLRSDKQPGHQRVTTPSSSSSESWSGDSGYFIPGAATQARPPVRPSTPPSKSHIDEWLSSISPEDGLSQGGGFAANGSQKCTTAKYTPFDMSLMPPDCHADLVPKLEEAKSTRQPLLNTRQESNKPSKTALFTSNPLSPNVCVDRGSSRSQSSRTLRDPELPLDTPTKRAGKRGLGSFRQTSSARAAEANQSNRFDGKENINTGPRDIGCTYEWHATGPIAGRAQLWRSPVSNNGGPARPKMRGAGTSRTPH